MTVYFASQIDRPDLIKIGHTDNVTRRMRQLAASFENGIELLATTEGGKEAETTFHRMFSAFRDEGEWFKQNPALQAIIAFAAGDAGERTVFRRRLAGAVNSAETDCQLAHELVSRLLKASRELSIAGSLEEVFSQLYERNPVWSRRRVRSIWNCETNRIDHYEICDLQALAEEGRAQ